MRAYVFVHQMKDREFYLADDVRAEMDRLREELRVALGISAEQTDIIFRLRERLEGRCD